MNRQKKDYIVYLHMKTSCCQGSQAYGHVTQYCHSHWLRYDTIRYDRRV